LSALLAALSAVMYGAADFFGGVASRKASTLRVLFVSQSCGLAVALLASLVIPSRPPGWGDLLWGGAAGVFGVAGLAALYRALASTVVAVASPAAAIVGAVIPVAAGMAAGDHPGALAWAGVAAAVPAILLLTLGGPVDADGHRVRRALLLGIAAGVGFGLFFVAVSHAPRDSGLWPLAAARGVSFSAVALTSALAALRGAARRKAGVREAARVRETEPRVPLSPATYAAGVLDMGANIAFLLASRAGMLTTAAVIVSLYPAPTVLLARVVWKERLPASRIVGVALAVAGVALISLR
jgi:drug/metabolite transporter (DMT)-like permease